MGEALVSLIDMLSLTHSRIFKLYLSTFFLLVVLFSESGETYQISALKLIKISEFCRDTMSEFDRL